MKVQGGCLFGKVWALYNQPYLEVGLELGGADLCLLLMQLQTWQYFTLTSKLEVPMRGIV